MPDFTMEVYFHCQSAEDWETRIPSSKGDKTYRVWVGRAHWPGAAQYEFQCECKSFQYLRRLLYGVQGEGMRSFPSL